MKQEAESLEQYSRNLAFAQDRTQSRVVPEPRKEGKWTGLADSLGLRHTRTTFERSKPLVRKHRDGPVDAFGQPLARTVKQDWKAVAETYLLAAEGHMIRARRLKNASGRPQDIAAQVLRARKSVRHALFLRRVA